MAPAATTATMAAGLADNSTESGGAGQSGRDMFTSMKDKFFNELNSLPRECPGGWREGQGCRQEGPSGRAPEGGGRHLCHVPGWVLS